MATLPSSVLRISLRNPLQNNHHHRHHHLLLLHLTEKGEAIYLVTCLLAHSRGSRRWWKYNQVWHIMANDTNNNNNIIIIIIQC